MATHHAQSTKSISQGEIEKIKTLIDFIFHDQTKQCASFKRFEEIFAFANDTAIHVDLFKVFKEIVGENKKYLTIQRFIKMYLSFKAKAKGISLDTKKFISYITSSLLRPLTLHVGNDVNTLLFSSFGSVNQTRMSKLTILETSTTPLSSILSGFKIEYDDVFNVELCDSTVMSTTASEAKLLFMNELKAYDAITDIFGNYTNKIEFIAFKCRSGKIVKYGSPKGEPFLYGEYGKKLKCLKTKIDSSLGVMMIQPLFEETSISNYAIDIIRSRGDNDDVINNEDLIYEEKVYNDKGEKMSDEVIKCNIIKDTEGIWDISSDEINLIKPNRPSSNKKEIFDIESIKRDATDYYTKIQNEKNFPKKEQKQKLKKSLHISIPSSSSKASIRQSSIEEIITSKDNYEQIISRLKFEIEREIHKEYLKYDYDQNFDFYDEYLMKYELLDPFPLSPKHFDSYGVVKDIEYDFTSFNDSIKKEEKKQIYSIQNKNDSFDDSTINFYWRTASQKLTQLNTTSLISAIIALRKAIVILENVEDAFYDDHTNLRTKILIYKNLIKHKRSVTYVLNSISNYDIFMRKKERNEKKVPTMIRYNDITITDEDMNTNLSNVNKKIKMIESIIDDNPSMHNQLSLYYMKLRKIRMLLLSIRNEEEEEKIKNLIPDYDRIKNAIDNDKLHSRLNQGDTIVAFPTGDLKTIAISALKLSPNLIYKKQKIDENVFEYLDPLFPINESMLSQLSQALNVPQLKASQSDMILYTNNYVVLPNVNHIDANVSMISKGLYQSNYFVTAMNALMKYPSLIYNLFPFLEKSINGCYGVYLRINGIWKLVLLDETFPCCVNNRGIRFFALASTPEKEIWINLIEKAFAKISGGYDKILNGNVIDVFDAVTNSIIEKHNVISNEETYKVIDNAVNEKFIVVAKAKNNFDKNVGIVKNENYIINSIRNVNIGAITEILIEMKNIFGAQKFSGNWSNDNYKWIPSLKNLRYNNDNQFFISLNDFVNFFSVIYVVKVHPIENEDNFIYSHIKYSKFEISKPNLAIITVPKSSAKTKIYIQLHRKKSICYIPSYLLLIDSKNRYIKSLSSNDNIINIDIDLSEGDYYLISDVGYRYYNRVDHHGYTVSIYTNSEATIAKDTDSDVSDILRKALLSYSRKNIEVTKGDFGVKIYDSAKALSKTATAASFPFEYIIYENASEFDIETSMKIKNKYDTVRNYALYLDEDNEIDNGTVTKAIKAGETNATMVLRLKNYETFDIENENETKITDEELQEYILRCGSREQLDEEEMLIQYMIEYKGGYCVLIENKYDDEEFKMKLILKGLIYEPQRKGDVYFRLKQREIKLFKLKVSELNASGIVSFQFQFA